MSATDGSHGEHAAAERDRAFRKARRHTIFVRALRWALPGSAALALAAYGALIAGTMALRDRGVRLGDISITADDLKMKNPSYFGVGKDGSKYEVRAKEAIVDMSQTGPIKLFTIDGDLYQTSGTRTQMKATRGTLDNKSGRLELFDGVEIDGSDGMKARLRSAEVLTKESRISSKEPVIAAMPAGTARGNSLVLNTKQRVGMLVGDVQLELQPGDNAGRTSSGIGGDARQPVLIDADRMDFDDTVRRVVFKDNVRARQGDTNLAAPLMVVDYEGKPEVAGAAAKAATPGSNARISKIAARSGVAVVAGADRRIRSETADFDLKADTALFAGPAVEATQGKNRMLGRRLAIDRKSGRTRLDAPAEGGQPAGRIQTTFIQTEADGKPKVARQTAPQGNDGVASFRTDPGAPMDIDAVSLDIVDTAKQAIFRGAVRAQQGDMTIQTEELIANYIGETGLSAPPEGQAPAAPGAPKAAGGAQLTKVEARSRVVVTSKDGQEAVGDWAIFDVKGNSVLLGGNVTVKRGRDIVSGPRLRIDLVTGQAHFEADPGARPVIAAPFRVIDSKVAAPAPKELSSPGPGGLPPVVKGQPVPAAPAANGDCPPPRQCATIFPEDAKKAAKDKAKPKVDAWQPSTSPSPVYRAPGQQ